MDRESIVKDLEARGIRWVELHFLDLAGYLRALEVPVKALASEDVAKLDGSSVKGFVGIEESDMVLKPDLSTLAVIPWNSKRARVIVDIYLGEGRGRFERDPRYIAQKARDYAKELGYVAYMGPEVEFMILDGIELDIETPLRGLGYKVKSCEYSSGNGYFQRAKQAYYTAPPIDIVLDIREEIAEALEFFGIVVEAHHHEVAAFGQVEIDIGFDDPVGIADKVVTLKYVARNIAVRHGKIAVFMPKPVYGDNGNGMHTHISLWDSSGSKNLFYDPSDEYAELSQLARYFIGGLLEHSRALAAIVAPTPNSYRRLVPGYEAPVYLVWSKANRSAAIRVPMYRRGDWKGKRIEYRPPDPSCNPYLAMAAMLMAGLDGVKRKIEPGDPVDRNVYEMSSEERKALGIKELPRSLDEALDELECDNDFLKPVFSKEVIESYIEMKRKEAEKVRLYPSPIELYMYLDI